MFRRALLLLSLAGLYIIYQRSKKPTAPSDEVMADASWANEGGANAPSTV